jgi:hypothetical protein
VARRTVTGAITGNTTIIIAIAIIAADLAGKCVMGRDDGFAV